MPKKKKNTDIEIPVEMRVYDVKRHGEIILDLVSHIEQVETFLFEDQCDISRANLLVSMGELFAVARMAKKAVE